MTSLPFAERHLGPVGGDAEAMLAELGLPDLEALLAAVLPAGVASTYEAQLPPPASEPEAIAALRELASRNQLVRPLIGTGYAPAVTPAVLLRNVLENPAWYTAYTPYQPEISQGRLEALLTFQTMVCDLTGLDVANASLLDEGTAAAEAMAYARRVVRGPAATFVIDADAHPQTIDVVSTRAEAAGVKAVVADLTDPGLDLSDAFGVLAQYPGTSGRVADLAPLARKVHEAGALLVAAADILALTLLTSPGEWGADVAVGTTQRFGLPLWFGGPHAAYMAVREQHQRQLPGRLVGNSIDSAGRPALRLALQTREQHIRREKATSNICTAQVLPAVVAAFYTQWHGPEGLRQIAYGIADLTARLAAGLATSPHTVVGDTAFDTVRLMTAGPAADVVAAAAGRGYDLRLVDASTVGISLDETCDATVVAELLEVLGGDVSAAHTPAQPRLPEALARTTPYLQHERFHTYRSETEMMRYLRRLSDRDLALDRTMIPLGSCTMKLNAATEMEAISWREFTDVHPFAPAERSAGYRELIGDLEHWLAELSGYDAVSVQPNSGAQGEFAGLLAIRRFHESRGDSSSNGSARDVILVPASAHGTNAASATLAGLRVAVVKTAGDGSIDLDDLSAVLTKHEGAVAGLMITYPSTHGVYEPTVREVCDRVHTAGGQVYLDGANLNALVGVARPGDLGADVSHFNLHKTFCIPHGGGGPGVGPIGVKAHLAPFLPSSVVVREAGPVTSPGAVSSAPWGSAGVLPISWAYVRLMGADGLRRATATAVLAANYVAARLRDAYPVLYAGPGGLVAHECILDLRPITAASGVTVEDVAKRLIDYGFHAPTMSFPVAGTLMVEPTESESKAELDRFVDAMLGIRDEIAAVERGQVAAADSVLRGAPHDARTVTADEWTRAYSRTEAAYPAQRPGHAVTGGARIDKYWPPVGRIDNAYGDRNLVCTCPPIEAYED